MVNYKYTDQLPQQNDCIVMKNYVEMKYSAEMNTQTNWLIDTNLNVGSRILRIVEFDLKILD